MREIIQVRPANDYFLEIEFSDGSRNLVDVKPLLQFPTFESIRDWDYFSRVKVDHKFGGVEWPNGTDICIDWIEAQITRQRPKVFHA